MKVRDIYTQMKFEFIPEVYQLENVSPRIYFGYSPLGELTLITETNENNAVSYSTINNSVELAFNKKIRVNSGLDSKEIFAHIVTCIDSTPENNEIFVDLCELYFSENDLSSKEISLVLNKLGKFFRITQDITTFEIQGFYAELFFMKIMYEDNSINISNFWQKREKMKFDFSLTSKLKVEVKSTVSSDRIHTFLHEQLSSSLYDIFIASVLMREENNGLSLECLINDLLSNYPLSINARENIIKMKHRIGKKRMTEVIYDEEYMRRNLKIYNAEEVPKIENIAPATVTDITYKSQLSGVEPLEFKDFIHLIEDRLAI